MPRTKDDNWSWVGFQASHDEKAALDDYCQRTQQSKTEVLRYLLRTLMPPEPNAKPKQLMQTKAPWDKNVLGSSTDNEPWTHPSAALVTQVQQLSAKVERLEEAIEDLIEQNLGIQPWSN